MKFKMKFNKVLFLSALILSGMLVACNSNKDKQDNLSTPPTEDQSPGSSDESSNTPSEPEPQQSEPGDTSNTSTPNSSNPKVK